MDRLVDAGLVHDPWGRITTLPGSLSKQPVSTGIDYYNTDLVRRLYQGPPEAPTSSLEVVG